VHVDVGDAELAAGLEVAVGPGVVQLPAARVAVPLGRVELDALEAEPLGVGMQLLEALLAVASKLWL
jgi:hypothetical protein